MAELAIGDAAPDFALPANDSTIRLTEFRGKIVVLFFYPKDNTQACTLEAIEFSRLKDAFTQAGAVVFGISPDSLKKHENFIRKHALTTSLLADETRQTIEAYGAWGQKKLYGREYMGLIRTTVLIDRNGRVARIWPNVRVPGHAEAVLEAVRSL